MAVLVTVSTDVKAEMGPKSPFTAPKLAGEAAVEVKSSKRREERRTVDIGRRASVHWENDERCKERRGSKASSRRQSVLNESTGELKERHLSLDRKREVLVTREG